MNKAALTSWLAEVEEAFGNFVKAFELLAAGKQPAPDQIARILQASRDYESQAKQMRSLIMNPDSSAQ